MGWVPRPPPRSAGLPVPSMPPRHPGAPPKDCEGCGAPPENRADCSYCRRLRFPEATRRPLRPFIPQPSRTMK